MIKTKVILSALPDTGTRRVISENESALIKGKNKPLRVRKLLEAIRQTRGKGCALHHGDLADIRAIAVAVKNRDGLPFAAISVAAISSRMTDDRHREIAGLLKDGARELKHLLAGQDVSARLN